MATATAPKQRLGSASRIGTIDPMGKGRVYVDETLTEVAAGSPEAAYVFKRGDLEARRERRTELGLDKNDEALRVLVASRKVEVASVERRMANLKAELEALTEEIATAEKAEAKGKSDAKSDDATVADAKPGK